jgi:hypothetical protein
MASRAKKTTFAKLNREQKLRERRQAKQARKDARKLEAAQPPEAITDDHDETVAGDEEATPDEVPVA